MNPTLAIHIGAGVVALVCGYVALYVAKGAPLHRKVGIVFVYAMLIMSVLGIAVSAGRGVAPTLNIPVGILTAYLVVTALTTVHPLAAERWVNVGALLAAAGLCLTNLAFGVQAARGGNNDGMPPFLFFMFGAVALMATVGDLRVLRFGALRGPARIARHLWRMCFALFLAALSFFIGQGAKVLPAALQSPALRALPVVGVLVIMFYWLWRVRVRKILRGLTM